MNISFEPWQSSEHDDRCCCPVCAGLCQDDYEFYSQTGQYAPAAQQALQQAQAEFDAVPSYVERFRNGREKA